MSAQLQNLYELLGVSKTANDDEIKKAYKKMALKFHPDRNINNKEEANVKFQEVNRAYQTLSNPEKRSRYDQFGVIDGVNDSGGGGGGMPDGFNPMDIFSNMFGGSMFGRGNGNGNGRGDKNNEKSPNKQISINISLIDVYKGRMVNIEFNKIICCEKCNGCGAKNKESITTCITCNGKGKIIKIMQMGNMIQQNIQHCNNCNGLGKMILPVNYCITCNGKKGIVCKRNIECYVRPGTSNGATISFKNESDWVAEYGEIGDLIVNINCKNDNGIFRREGNNLIIKQTITLLEALTATEFLFKHLDDRVIKISHNEIIKPNQQMLVKNEGMPQFQNDSNHGDLIINFDVLFPTELDVERSKYLCKILPLPKKQIWDTVLDNTPPAEITHYKLEHENSEQGHSKTHTKHTSRFNSSSNKEYENKDYENKDYDNKDYDNSDNGNFNYIDANTGVPKSININNPNECATQ